MELNGVVQRAQRDRHHWGTTRPTVVALRPVRAGARLTSADIALRALPKALLPVGSVHATTAIVGRTTRIDLVRDQIVLDSALSASTVTPGELLVGAGRVAVAVETGPGRPHLTVGNHVIIIPSADGAAANPVSVEGMVVALQDSFVTVSVASSHAPVLAAMIGTGPLVVALKGR